MYSQAYSHTILARRNTLLRPTRLAFLHVNTGRLAFSTTQLEIATATRNTVRIVDLGISMQGYVGLES